MIASIYSELIQYEETGGDMGSRIKALHVFDVFMPLYSYYEYDNFLINKALFFILHAYSLQSNFHVLGQDWMDIKKRVAAHVGITLEGPAFTKTEEEGEKVLFSQLLYNDLVLLESMEIVQTINNYLLYQDNRNFKHLCMLKDSYEQMISGAINPNEDFDQRAKNRKEAAKLLDEIESWEQRVADTNADLKDAMGEIKKKAPRKENKSLRAEDNLASDVIRK